MSDPRTIKVYEDRADDYAKQFDTGKPDKHLQGFIDALPRPAHVLDLGCGTGGSSASMVESGLTVTGWDASPKMLDHARTKSNAEFACATFDDLTEDRKYHGIWANFSLLHAPRDDFPRHLKAIYTALIPAGLFHVGLKTGSGQARDNIDRQYTYYQINELETHLTAAGFETIQTTTGESPGLAGDVEPWVICLTRKPS